MYLGADTSKQFGYNKLESDYAENQRKHQEEILKQSLEYGPLGVKLWFTGDSKEIPTSSSSSSGAQEPNRAPPDNTFQVRVVLSANRIAAFY